MKALSILLLTLSCVSNAYQGPSYNAEFGIEQIINSMASMRQLNRAVFNTTLYNRIREIWFGDLPWGAKAPNDAANDRWFTAKGEEKANFDKTCHKEFNTAIEEISPSKLPINGLGAGDLTKLFLQEIHHDDRTDDLERTKTALSFMILLDQIPRNLYRTNETLKLVYRHYDVLAVNLARHITSTKPRLDLHPTIKASITYRQWFYLPLMHSEQLADHEQFMNIVEEMKEENKDDPEGNEAVEKTLKFEKMHYDILKKLGRYPHRNECLGREPTAEEKEYLQSGGQTFGVAG